MHNRNLFFIVLIGFLISSCYPKGPEYVDELDIVGSFYDDEFNFQTPVTFHIPDTVIEIADPDDNNRIDYNHEYDDFIVDVIRANMQGKGYTYTDDPTEADLWLNASILITKNTYYYYDWWYYWWDYYYPWYPGWGGGYPGYWPGYPVVGVSSYTSGTIVVSMEDAAEVNNSADGEDPELHGVWVGVLNGVVSGSDPSSRIERGLTQAFEQSAYLGK